MDLKEEQPEVGLESAPPPLPGSQAGSEAARQDMHRKKVAIMINNEEYLRAHPELRTLVHGFVCALVEQKPTDVHAFASAWFTRPGLAASLGLTGWERPEDEAELAAAAAAASGGGLLAAGVVGNDGGSGAGAAANQVGTGSSAPAPLDSTSGASAAALEKQLVALFAQADKDGNGVLDQKELRALLGTASLRLRPTELRRLLAEVDEDADGNVSYAEFVPLAVQALQAMRAREKVSAAERELDAAAEAAASQLVNGIPRSEMLALALQVFEQYDADRSGQLSRRELKKVLQDARLGLSARQVRLVLSRLDTSNDGQLSFAEFAPLMADILAEQLRQELRAGQWGGLESRLRELIAEADGDGTGLLFRAQLVDVLLAQELVSISRMQANAMVAAAPEEADGSIRIDRFVPIAVAMLRALSSPEAVAERCAMLERADFTPIELMGGREREAMEATFAEAFAKYDVDNNRFLDEHEFELCLNSAALGLERHEIYALLGMADRNGDGQIDAKEFVGCAYGHLLQIKREQKIQAAQRAW